ncbi:MAG: hypothetical protein AAFW68_13610, partial [Pseudomonadota bacterium]
KPPGAGIAFEWVNQDRRHVFIGKAQIECAPHHLRADKNVTAILIDPLESNARARRFYERLGFEFLERRTFERDVCAVYRLDRASYERLAGQA